MTTPTEHTERAVRSAPEVRSQRSSLARVPAAFRLQFATPATLVWMPLLVFVLVWAGVIGIGHWIDYSIDRDPGEPRDPYYTGAAQSVVWVLAFMGGYAGSHTFPFSTALSYSRRVFVFGAVLAFGAVSAAYGLAFSLAAAAERATNGFGIEGYTFDLPFLTRGTGGIASAGLFAFLVCLTVMLLGFGMVILFKRLGLVKTWIALLAIVAVIAIAAMIITVQSRWSGIWQWVLEQSALSLSGWLALAVVALGVLNYLLIRRATPA